MNWRADGTHWREIDCINQLSRYQWNPISKSFFGRFSTFKVEGPLVGILDLRA